MILYPFYLNVRFSTLSDSPHSSSSSSSSSASSSRPTYSNLDNNLLAGSLPSTLSALSSATYLYPPSPSFPPLSHILVPYLVSAPPLTPVFRILCLNNTFSNQFEPPQNSQSLSIPLNSSSHLLHSLPLNPSQSLLPLLCQRSGQQLSLWAASHIHWQPHQPCHPRSRQQSFLRGDSLFLSSLTHVETLDLSANQLAGTIPGAISSMPRLRQLNLSSNSLAGSVPSTTTLLTNLTSLDLSRNNLSGTIPASFSTLTGLQALDLSYNPQLSGSVPASLGQLSNLTMLATNATSTTCPLPSTPCEVPQSLISAFCQACPDFCSSCCTSCTDPCTSYPSNPCGPGDCIPTSSPPTPASASTKGAPPPVSTPAPPVSATFSPPPPPNSSYTCRCSAGAAAAVGANGLPTCVIPSPPPQESSSAVAMPTGAIIGIAVASFAVLVCCFTLIFLCWRWRHTSQSRELVNQGTRKSTRVNAGQHRSWSSKVPLCVASLSSSSAGDGATPARAGSWSAKVCRLMQVSTGQQNSTTGQQR
ncbi:unnamed protein product [Closterium sp. Yama58-4]|nr:unnamed protein product [Closterium sp. Yama58-4]